MGKDLKSSTAQKWERGADGENAGGSRRQEEMVSIDGRGRPGALLLPGSKLVLASVCCC